MFVFSIVAKNIILIGRGAKKFNLLGKVEISREEARTREKYIRNELVRLLQRYGSKGRKSLITSSIRQMRQSTRSC